MFSIGVSYVRFAFLQISQEKLFCADIELSLFDFLFLTIKKLKKFDHNAPLKILKCSFLKFTALWQFQFFQTNFFSHNIFYWIYCKQRSFSFLSLLDLLQTTFPLRACLVCAE